MTAIHCNNEFKTVFSQLSQTHQIKINTVAAQSHVSKAEQNNCVIKERIHCAYHNLDYQNVPKTVLIYMVQELANKLNYFLA